MYMSDTLRWGTYSNKQGKLGTLSMGKVELKWEIEAAGETEEVDH